MALVSDVHQAAHNGDLPTLRLLLARDPALIRTKDQNGFSPVHAAVYRGRLDCVREMLSGSAAREYGYE